MAHESVYPLQSETDLRNIPDGLYAIAKQAMEQGESPKIKNLLEIAKSEVPPFTTSRATTAARRREQTAKS